MLIPGTASQSLAAALAKETGRRLCVPDIDRFPDGEFKTSVPEFDGSRATIIAATATDEAFVELLQLQDAIREAGGEHVTTVVPYMGYARQDQAFEAGEPVSARAMARAISTGTDRVVLVNPHEASVASFFDTETTVVDAARRLAEPLPSGLNEPLFLAPDENATDLADVTRDAYGRGRTDHFEKVRDYETGEVTIKPSDAGVTGRDVVVVDDIIATGSTMSEAINRLQDQEPDRVFAACIHPLLVGAARTRLEVAGVERVVGTDTVERKESVTTVAPVVANAI